MRGDITIFEKDVYICYGDFWSKNVYATAEVGVSACKRFDKL